MTRDSVRGKITGRRCVGWRQNYLRKYYFEKRDWVDGTAEFHALCDSRISPGSRILEIGAGPSNRSSQYLASLGSVVGIDIDPAVKTNRYLANAFVLQGTRYPFEDECFDACVSNYVLEHIEDPVGHLREVARVLKSGGVYVFRTPNIYHYVSIVARMTPHWLHIAVSNRLRGHSAEGDAPCRTFHRMNSRRAISNAAEAAGLAVRGLRMVEKEPSYGVRFRALFMLFLVYERVVNAFNCLAIFRANVFGVLEKPREDIHQCRQRE